MRQLGKEDRSFIISILAIIISIVSVAFTGLSFYYQYVRENEDVTATILSAFPGGGGIGVEEGIDAACYADIIFTNNGNRQCSVASVFLQEKVLDIKGEEKEQMINIPFSNQSAFTLKSGDVVSRQFIIRGKRGITDSRIEKVKKGEEVDWSVVFCVVDTKGYYHKVKESVFYRKKGEKHTHVIVGPAIVRLLPSPYKDMSLFFNRRYDYNLPDSDFLKGDFEDKSSN